MRIYLASDHAGFDLKEKLKVFLAGKGYAVEDCGAYKFDPTDDYPDFIRKAAEAVAGNPGENRAIVLGGTGEGEAMAANRLGGVRAAVYYGGMTDMVKLSREHNDANVLSLGARFLTESEAVEAVDLWLATPFSGDERHRRRIAKF
jgi:ribose 5-phosphate isomerase B